MMNLLESAGFSRSNPYYIVKQGKVRLTVMNNNVFDLTITIFDFWHYAPKCRSIDGD